MKAWILRHGQVGEVSELERLSPERVALLVGGRSYKVELSEVQEAHGHLVVIDGILLRHGVPRSARVLRNEVALSSPTGTLPFLGLCDEKNPERFTDSSRKGNVRRESGLPPGAGNWGLSDGRDDYQNSPNEHKGILTVTFARWFWWLPKSADGKRLCFFRYKPVSLERQYICVESHKNEVKFITQNHW